MWKSSSVDKGNNITDDIENVEEYYYSVSNIYLHWNGVKCNITLDTRDIYYCEVMDIQNVDGI